MTELELKEKIYRAKTIGKSTIETPRTATPEKIAQANSIVSNLMNYILVKHS